MLFLIYSLWVIIVLGFSAAAAAIFISNRFQNDNTIGYLLLFALLALLSIVSTVSLATGQTAVGL
jgi:hypothetical protein